MKERISATVDDGTSKKIDKLVKEGKFRNRSDIIERAIKKFLEVESNNGK
jgi:Arc/MetJ-type ribon-helix-helix transcriptional regulator